MSDLNKLIEDIEMLPHKIYQASIISAEKRTFYESLKEGLKHKRAAIENCFGEKSQAKAETMSYASARYGELLEQLTSARLESLKAEAMLDYLKLQYDSNKTQQIAIMAQMKLV